MRVRKGLSLKGMQRSLLSRYRSTCDSAEHTAREWNEHMLAADTAGTAYGTRWGRTSVVVVPSVLIVASLATAIVQGALAANFNVANTKLSLSADHLHATGFSGVLGTTTYKQSDGSSKQAGVLRAGIRAATIDGTLCVLVNQPLPIGSYTLVIKAGGGDAQMQVANLIADATQLVSKSKATLGGAGLGVSGDDVAFNGKPLGAAPGSFGLDLSNGYADLTGAQLSAYDAVISGALQLPNADISVVPGTKTSC